MTWRHVSLGPLEYGSSGKTYLEGANGLKQRKVAILDDVAGF
jgi:hypothetical protein